MAPSYRQAFRKGRCLVLADGFFEWKKKFPGGKIPYSDQHEGQLSFFFAGLWEDREEFVRTILPNARLSKAASI
jgi:putative SOS response-associated peptidase YedK